MAKTESHLRKGAPANNQQSKGDRPWSAPTAGSAAAGPRGLGDESHRRERGELRGVVGLGAGCHERGGEPSGKGRETTSGAVTANGLATQGLGAKPQAGGQGAHGLGRNHLQQKRAEGPQRGSEAV